MESVSSSSDWQTYFILHSLISKCMLKFPRLIGASAPQSRSKLIQHPRYRKQEKTDEAQKTARPRDAERRVHLEGEQREDGAKGIA